VVQLVVELSLVGTPEKTLRFDKSFSNINSNQEAAETSQLVLRLLFCAQQNDLP